MPPVSTDKKNTSYNPSLPFLYKRHRSQLQLLENLNLKPVPLVNNDSTKSNTPYGGTDNLPVNRIYPRQITKQLPNRRPSNTANNNVTSPLLSALGSATNTAAQYTSDWARSLPQFNGNINLASSPPALSIGRDVSISSSYSPSSAPNMRPQSHPNQTTTHTNQITHQTTTHYQPFGGRQRLTSQNRDRRSSTISHQKYSQYTPLPHQDQAHFHPGGLPDLDSIGIATPIGGLGGLSPGEKNYCCTYDTLSTSGHSPSLNAENVLIVGWEGGFRIQRISRKTIDIVGSIEGLRGGVYGAKILPWTFRQDPGSNDRPYIAVIIHGPVFEQDSSSNHSNDSDKMSREDQDTNSEISVQQDTPTLELKDLIKTYQTTVEIFSLSRKKHVATIFKSPPIEVEYSQNGDFKPPPPNGDLQLNANGKFITVASGVSGEVFVFSPFTRNENIYELESIRCIGKFWTSIQKRDVKTPSISSNGEQLPSTIDEADLTRSVPILSLSQRWLALVPPPPESLFSLNGNATLSNQSIRPPGITSHVPPSKPTTNCSIEVPEAESLMDKVSREVTQKALKGAQWLSQQSSQAWNTYFNRGLTNGQLTTNISNQQIFEPTTPQLSFPPTHGFQYNNMSSESPTQVAIYDLQKLLDNEEVKIKNILQPLSTFEPPSGCSFLSFSPNGLLLLTVSRKGDQKLVWNLMRLQHSRSKLSDQTQDLNPHVRLIARFTRLTSSTTIDVIWTTPENRFALLTDKGTIHVHELPCSSLSWPLRRLRRPLIKPKSHIPESEINSASSKGAMETTMETTMNAINGTSSWIRSAMRPKSIGTTSNFSTNLIMAPAVTANVSGKIVKDGFNKSVKLVANSANTMYHASENKLHMGSMLNGVSPGSLRWMTGKDRGCLAIIVTGTVNIYAVKQVSEARKGLPPLLRAKISKKPIEFALQKIPDDQFSPACRNVIESKLDPNGNGNYNMNKENVTGFWYFRAPNTLNLHNAVEFKPIENWHALVEAETNPPYQPFHTDRRVGLFTFADPEAHSTPYSSQGFLNDTQGLINERQNWNTDVLGPWLREVHHVDPEIAGVENWPASPPEPWMFGLEVPSTLVQISGVRDGFSTGLTEWGDDEDTIENRVTVVEGADGEQVLVTTVTRSGGHEEEFFEDDVEVIDLADDRV